MKKVIILTVCILGYTLLQAQVLTGEQKAKDLLQKAENAYENNFHELAVEYFNEAYSIYPNAFNSVHYCKIGYSYFQMGKNSQALTYYQKATSLNPFLFEAYNNMGCCYNKLGNYKQAISCFQKAISLNPDYENTYYNMANSNYNLGNYNQAIICYQKAILINPNFTQAYQKMGKIYEKLGNQEQADLCYKKAQLYNKYNPNEYNPYLDAGIQGDIDKRTYINKPDRDKLIFKSLSW